MNILLRISSISRKNWTPTSGLLNKNARNNLLAILLASSVAHPNIVEGTYGLELRRRWDVSITEVIRISAIGIINYKFLKNTQNNLSHKTAQQAEQES